MKLKDTVKTSEKTTIDQSLFNTSLTIGPIQSALDLVDKESIKIRAKKYGDLTSEIKLKLKKLREKQERVRLLKVSKIEEKKLAE